MNQKESSNSEPISNEEKMHHFLEFNRLECSKLPTPYPLLVAFGESVSLGFYPSETIVVTNYTRSFIDVSEYEENTYIEKIEYPAVTRDGFFTISTAIKKNEVNHEISEDYPHELRKLQDIIKIQKKVGFILPSYIHDRPQGYVKGNTGSHILIGNIRIGEATKWTPSNKIILEKDLHGEKFSSVMQKVLSGLLVFSTEEERKSIVDYMNQLKTEFDKVADITK